MSHEGIRFQSREEKEHEDFRNRPLPRIATTPEKVRVLLTEGKGVEIDWADGHKSAWSFAWLRNACPCATCHEERESSGRRPGVPRPETQMPLRMYKDPAQPVEVIPVGKYALKFRWNDGHETGIYSWEYLRRVCECEDCRAN